MVVIPLNRSFNCFYTVSKIEQNKVKGQANNDRGEQFFGGSSNSPYNETRPFIQ
jgi:hypothetical protein